MCYMILYGSNMIKSTVPWSKWRADLPWSIFMACFTMLRPRFLAQRVCHGAGESMGRLMFRQSHIIVLAVYRSYICIYLYVSYVFKYVCIYIYVYISNPLYNYIYLYKYILHIPNWGSGLVPISWGWCFWPRPGHSLFRQTQINSVVHCISQHVTTFVYLYKRVCINSKKDRNVKSTHIYIY